MSAAGDVYAAVQPPQGPRGVPDQPVFVPAFKDDAGPGATLAAHPVPVRRWDGIDPTDRRPAPATGRTSPTRHEYQRRTLRACDGR